MAKGEIAHFQKLSAAEATESVSMLEGVKVQELKHFFTHSVCPMSELFFANGEINTVTLTTRFQ